MKVIITLSLLFVFPLALKTVLTVQLKKTCRANLASRLRNLRLTQPQEQLIALRHGIRLKSYILKYQLRFHACAQKNFIFFLVKNIF